LPGDRHVLHVVRQHFIVDGQEGVLDPLGMPGAHLEVDVHVVHGFTNRLQTAIRVVKGLELEVENIVFNGIASSLAVLTAPEKQQGALVVDLGAGITEYVLYADGVIRHTGTLAVGGDHVTNDLAFGLKVAMGRAEALKLEHGAAFVAPDTRGRTIPLPGEPGLPERSVNLEHLHRIMASRLEETFEIIAAQLEARGLLDCPRAGIVLCGGGARVPGVDRSAERIFGLPVALGRTKTISGLAATLDHPEFATGIGLVKFGSFQGASGRGPQWTSRLRATFGSLTSAFRRP
jgi:cell division protein FtsA